MKTRVITGKECHEAIMQGVNLVADIVESSLGPRSAFTGISYATPQGDIYNRVILKDGVSIAKAIDLRDERLNFSARILLEAAQKSVQDVGDGTTATICLARAFIVEADKRIAAGISPMAIKDELEPDITKALELLKKKAIPVKTLEQKIQIATVSCEEADLGVLIGETIHKVGDEGVVTVENSKSGDTRVEFQEGMQWDRGLASPYFMTNPDTLTGVIEDGYILVTDHEINNIMELKPFLDQFITKSRFLTIIAPEFGGDALTSLIANKMQNILLPLCIKAPSFGGQQTNMLQDIAILTNATFITKAQGHKLEDVRFEHLGRADKVESSQNTAIVSGGTGSKIEIRARIEEIKKLIKDETNDFELERLRERLAKLTNGVAVIRVGGATDVEIKERYERALDATLATRQAVKYGIVPGGETVYLSLIKEMKSQITKKALEAPFRRLVINAGMDAGQMLERLSNGAKGTKKYISSSDSGISAEDVAQIDMDDPDQRLLVRGNPKNAVQHINVPINNAGIDVITGKIQDMVRVGIIDPVSVSINALTNALSVALQLLTTQNIIIPEIEEKK